MTTKVPIPGVPTEGQPPIAVNPFGPTELRQIKRQKIVDSEVILSDGTKMVIRPLVADIRRAVDQYNAEGQPLYFLTLGHSITTQAPKRLLNPALKKTSNTKKRVKS